MNLTISGHHLDVTPALHSYVVSKLERVVRHFDQVVKAAVILVVDPHTEKETRQKAEITLRLKGKVIFVACASSSLTQPWTLSSTNSIDRSCAIRNVR